MAASDGRSAAGRGELNRPPGNLYRIGIDVGGTFTDVVGIASDGTQTLAKAASTPADQSIGVVEGLRNLAAALELPLEALLRQTDRPVTQVAWDDAQAYAHWAGRRLPTEAEHEFASRGGGKDAAYAWGDERCPRVLPALPARRAAAGCGCAARRGTPRASAPTRRTTAPRRARAPTGRTRPGPSPRPAPAPCPGRTRSAGTPGACAAAPAAGS